MKVEVAGASIVGDIVIEAPPELVFESLVNPVELAEWWGQEGVYRPRDWKVDPRPGGERSCHAVSASGAAMTVTGEHLEIDPPYPGTHLEAELGAHPARNEPPLLADRGARGHAAAHRAHRLRRRSCEVAGSTSRRLDARPGMAQRLFAPKASGQMKRLILLALAIASSVAAQQAKEYWLFTFQLAPGIDLPRLTTEQRAVLFEHRNYVSTLYAKGLVMGGHTNEPVGPRDRRRISEKHGASVSPPSAAVPASEREPHIKRQ